MPSSYTASARYVLEATGENNNTWGAILNAGVFALIDTAIAGWLAIALTGDMALSTVNGATDQARSAMLKFTGAGGWTVTIPAASKKYTVWNACAADITISNGSASVVVRAGEVVTIVSDGGAALKRVVPSDFGGAALQAVGSISLSGGTGLISGLAAPTANSHPATKKYVDDTAFAMASGALPGQGGNAGAFLTTDGFTASWGALAVANIGNFAAGAAAIRVGASASAITPTDLFAALAEVALTDAATIAVDMETFINASVTLGGNRTLGNPTNAKPGQGGTIRVIQDGTGGWTLAFGANWKRPGGAPVLSTAAGAEDDIAYYVQATGRILYDLKKSPS